MYYYIVNPAAGGAKINRIQDRLKDRLKRLGIMGEFVKSTGPEDVAKLARIGIDKGFKTIVAVGGDGTINEVMNAILDNDRVALGIIPTGTTNDLASALGINDWYSATAILASRKIEEVNLGKIADRHFVTSVSIGFDPKIAGIKRLSRGNIVDRIRFGIGIFKEATTYRPIKAQINIDGNYDVTAECFNVIVSNSNFSPFSIKSSKKYENLLNTVVITKIPGSKVLKYGFLANTSMIELPKISVFHSKNITISTKKPVDVTADGQVVGKTPVHVQMSSKKVRVIVSRKRKI
jgi:YegS/Rv2252/BmrU family lipid kinase